MPNLQATVQSIPRTIVRNSFDAARLPLTVAESLLRRGDKTAEWAPALAFESVEANVKQVVGEFLRDEELAQEGRLGQAKVAQLRKAVELETVAEQAKLQADAEYRERRQADEQARQRIEQQADARESALQSEKARAKREADAKAREQAETARKIEAAQQKAIAKQERAARAAKVAAAENVLDERREAMEAAETVLDLDQAIKTTKAVRKAR